MSAGPGGYTKENLILCPVSKKNAADDLLYTIVQTWFLASGSPEIWASVQSLMYTNYNETFRDLLVTWLRIIRQVREIA